MEHKLQRLSLLVGILLYLFDYGSDIHVAVQYWKNDKPWWFGTTVALICVPSIIVSFTAIFQFMDIWRIITAIVQLSIVARYIEALAEPRTGVGDISHTYLLAILRHIETITESAPQLCLQVYIMLRQWSFPSYTVVPSVFSLYVDIFRYYVIIALAVWLTLGSTIILIETFDSGDFRRSFFLSFLAAFPSLLHSSRCPKPVMIVGYVVLITATIIMVTLCVMIKVPDIPHIDILQPIAIVFVTGVLPLSIVNLCCYIVRIGTDDD